MSETAPASQAASERMEDSVAFAYRSIREDILTGRLEPGAMISQVGLARALGISRTPLREALRQLSAESLIVGDFNRRMRVSELDLSDFDQIYAARIALEPVGIAATVPLLDNSQKQSLRDSVAGMDDAMAGFDMETFRAHHRAFHLGLTALAGPRIERILAELWDHSERYRLSYLHVDHDQPQSASRARLEVSQDEHRDILAAAIGGDGDRCAVAIVAHLQRTLEGVFLEAEEIPRPRLGRQALRVH